MKMFYLKTEGFFFFKLLIKLLSEAFENRVYTNRSQDLFIGNVQNRRDSHTWLCKTAFSAWPDRLTTEILRDSQNDFASMSEQDFITICHCPLEVSESLRL